MTDVFAKSGEPVTTPQGKYICRIKHDLRRHTLISAADFHEFADDEPEWKAADKVDLRCIRENSKGGLQICIDGEWRP